MEKKNFKLFFAMVTVIMVVLFGSVFTSCSNDDDLLLAGDAQTELVSSLDQDSVKGMTRGMLSSYDVMNDVVEQHGINDYDSSVLNYFVHWCQLVNNENMTNYCAPTSFMMSVACLLNRHNAYNKFNVSASKLSDFAQVGVPGASYDHVSDISYIQNTYPNIQVQYKSFESTTLSRDQAKSMLENSLDFGYFVVASVKCRVSAANQDKWFSHYRPDNPDLINNGTYGYSYYMEKTGYTNHAIIILRIDKFSTGNGIVTYIDPYNTTRSGSNRRYCLYSRLMDSMNFDTNPSNSGKYYFTRLRYY
jgi:hypothetical protein